MKTRAFTMIALLMALSVQFPAFALAHAFLDRSEPKVGSESAAAPAEVKIWFTQEIEPAFSKIRVFDSAGKEVDKVDSHQDKDDKRLLVVALEPLAAGTYKVEWSVVSVDTHHTKGNFKFVVRGAG